MKNNELLLCQQCNTFICHFVQIDKYLSIDEIISIDIINMVKREKRNNKMQKKISAMDARKNFGQVLNEAAYRGDDFIIERAGKAMAVIVSMEKYEIMRQSREEARTAADIIKNKMQGTDPASAESLIAEAILAVRSE